MKTKFGLLLPLLLAACGGSPASPHYSLNAVLPSPATPGEALTVFGNLPSNAKLTLDGLDIESVAVSGGVRVMLPERETAGDHLIKVQGTDLAGNAQVIPRLDAVTLNQGTLTLRGVGWTQDGKLATGVQTYLNGSPVIPVLKNDDLSVPLPSVGVYGALSVRVAVGAYSSQTTTLLHEAAAVRGTVKLPASTAQVQGQAISLSTPLLDKKTLIVKGALDRVTLSGLTSRSNLSSLHLTRLSFRDEPSAEHALLQLRAFPNVQGVSYDRLMRTDGVQSQGAPTPTGLGKQWFWPLEGVPDTWKVTQGEGVTVAVVDTGVALDHPDLKANLLPGHDFVDEDALPEDHVGHGTHVAGLIAANGQVSGAAPRAKLLPVRVIDTDRGGSAFTVAQGLLWAANLLDGVPNPHPAQIVNLSLGTPDDSDALREAVSKVQGAGVLVVAATGNTGGGLNYPAAYPGVLSVTAVAGPTTTYQPGYASKGPGTAISAYGGDLGADQDGDGVRDGVLSTDLVGGAPGYGLRMGTSMASPQVAGMAALALSAGTPGKLLRDTLLSTSTDLGPLGEDLQFGRGLVSGRAARPLKPRSYLLALGDQNQVLSWTPVSSDGSFVLGNLDPVTSVHLVAASDNDGNGVLGEAGELVSQPTATLTLKAGTVLDLPALQLEPSKGNVTYLLEQK